MVYHYMIRPLYECLHQAVTLFSLHSFILPVTIWIPTYALELKMTTAPNVFIMWRAQDG